MAWASSTLWIKGAFILLNIANLFMIAGFAAPGWVRKYVRGGGITDYGLWMICYSSSMGCMSAVGRDLLGDWYKACQAMITCGLITLWMTLATALVYIYTPKVQRHLGMAYAIVILSFITVCFNMVGIVVYGMKSMEALTIAHANAHLFYSFGFCITATVLTAMVGLLTIGDIKEVVPDDL